MMIKVPIILIFLLQFTEIVSDSTSAVWVGSDDYQSGTIMSVSNTGTLTFNYAKAFDVAPKKMLIGYTSIKSSNFGTTFRIDVTVLSTGTSNGVVEYQFYTGGITITAIQLRYMVVSSTISWLSCNSNLPFDYYMWYLNPGCPGLFTGNGQRSCYLTGNFFTGTGTTLDLTHKNVMLIWPQVLKMNTVAGRTFAFDWTSIWVNSTNYQIKLTLYGNTTISNLSYNRLIYDQTAIEANQTVYLDGDVLNGSSSDFSELSLSLLFTSANSFMIGLSYWNIPQTSKFDYTFDVGSFSTAGTMNFNSISLAYWNYRFRTCPTGYTYYIESQNKCYNQCDPYFYPQASPIKTCLACYYYCYKCSSNTSTACTDCSADDGRALSAGKCLCSQGYYQSNVKKCGKCHYSCKTCSGSADSNCLTCPTTRTPSSNKCPCTSPLIDIGEATCMNCTTQITGCLTCTSKTVCTSCDTSKDFQLSSSKCVCKTGTFLNGSICSSCTGAIVGCSECSSSSTCVTCKADQFFELNSSKCMCKSKYYNNSNICSLCSSAIVGCDVCSSSSTCTTCSSALFFVSNGSKCSCQTGYYNSSNTCTLCSSSITGCNQCSSSSACTACNTALFVLNGSVCSCKAGYYNNSNICTLCSSAMTGCNQCSSSSTCTACNTVLFVLNGSKCSCKDGYYNNSNTCTLCSDDIIGCTKCTSSSVCTACDTTNSFLLNTSDSKCICSSNKYLNITNSACQSCHVNSNCSKCSNSTYCTECNTLLMFPDSGVCTLCSSLVTGCKQCSSLVTCDVCDSTLFFQEDNSGGCICMQGRFFNSTNHQCQLCSSYMVGCVKCNVQNICLDCNGVTNFQLVSGKCECIDKYYLINASCLNCSTSCMCLGYYGSYGSCATHCGDGIFIDEFEECDDGNLENKDGCSSSCTIQYGFSCSNSSNQTISHCSYTLPLDIGFIEISKDENCNCLNLVVTIGPNDINLNNLNFSEIIVPNIDGLVSTSFVYKDGKVYLTYKYYSNIEGQNVTFTLTPSKDNSFNLTPNSSINIMLQTKDNQLLVLYDDDVYEKDSSFNYIYYGSMIASYFVFIMSMFTNKIVGIEMMGVIQIAFFALANLSFLTPYMKAMAKLKMVNGFNYEYVHQKDTPINIFGLKYVSQISNNLNIMLMFPVICVIMGCVLFLLSKSKCIKRKKSLEVLKWSKRFFKQYFLTSTMFSLYNISFSTAVFLKYNLNKTYFLYDMIVLVLSNLCVLILIGILAFTLPSQFGEYKHKLKTDFMSKHYFIISICYRYTLGFIIGHFNSHANITIIQFFLSSAFIVYLLSNRPFVEGYHNYRGLVCEGTTLCILSIGMFYRSMKENTPIQIKARILNPSYLHISSIIICLVVSGCVFGYEAVTEIKEMVKSKNKRGLDSLKMKNLTESHVNFTDNKDQVISRSQSNDDRLGRMKMEVCYDE